jgi:single stranded DNA-binding protein
MSSLNSTSFIGNLAADPIIKDVGEQRVTNFRIAVNEMYNDVQKTTWINCSAWNDLADYVVTNLHKGSQVYVSGRLDISHWDREVTAPISGEVMLVKTESMSINCDNVFDTSENENLNLIIPDSDLVQPSAN